MARLTRLVKGLLWTLRHGSNLGRFAMMWTYFRIELKLALLVRCLKMELFQETVWGQTLDFPDYELFEILFEEIYLPGTYSFRSAQGRRNIIDCGANVGMAIAYLLTLYPEATVTAFEPDEGTFKFLARNREQNRWTNVELHQAAVHRAEDNLTFFSHPTAPLASSFRKSISASEPTRVIEMRTVRLSSYVDRPVDLLKLDVEGSEIAVLEDLVESGKLQFIDQIIMEFHHHIEPDEDRLGYFLGLLEQNGFGYELRAPIVLPFAAGRPHNFMIFAYQKTPARKSKR
jgi:FkbM family methyltransferase